MFGAPNPFAQSAAPANPFGQTAPSTANPFAQGASAPNPFGQQAAQPAVAAVTPQWIPEPGAERMTVFATSQHADIRDSTWLVEIRNTQVAHDARMSHPQVGKGLRGSISSISWSPAAAAAPGQAHMACSTWDGDLHAITVRQQPGAKAVAGAEAACPSKKVKLAQHSTAKHSASHTTPLLQSNPPPKP